MLYRVRLRHLLAVRELREQVDQTSYEPRDAHAQRFILVVHEDGGTSIEAAASP